MVKESETVLVASLGTTPEPVVQVVEHARQEGPVSLFLVYGRAIGRQKPTPFEIVGAVKQKAEELGVPVSIAELEDPEDLDKAIQLFRQVMRNAADVGPARILVDYTGGTKVMAAALIHAVLSEHWGPEVILRYVGGARGSNGRVTEMVVQTAPDTGSRELARRVIESLRNDEYARAWFLSENLPKRGKYGFLRKTAHLLWLWDASQYEEASPLITECAPQARVLVDDTEYATLADTVIRLSRVTDRIGKALQRLRELEQRGRLPLSKGATEGWVYVLGDTIAAARRRVRSSPTESVLRSYRAVEVAIQQVLVSQGVSPWRPDWSSVSETTRSAYREVLDRERLPSQLSLWDGLKLVELLNSPLSMECLDDIQKIMFTRNHSHLEHGYDRVSTETARSTLVKMETAVKAIMEKVGLGEKAFECAEELELRV